MRRIVKFLFAALAMTCFSNAVYAAEELKQDASLLMDGENGRILAQEKMDGWTKKNADVFKIGYASDGLIVTGYVMQPRAEGRYPLLIFCRGGHLERYMLNKEYFAYLAPFAEKFILVGSQLRGNDGGDGEQDYAGGDVDDVVNIYKLGRSLPNFNGDVYVFGMSEGAVDAYLALARGPEGISAKAAFVLSGVADLKAWHKAELPDEDCPILQLTHKQLAERNPLAFANRIACPILLADGAKDQKVSPDLHGAKMAAALEAAGAPVERKIFPDGDHVLNNTPGKAVQLALAWFDAHQ